MLFPLVAAQVNLDSSSSVAAFSKKASARLLDYYKTSPGPDGQGAVLQNPSQDQTGVQWWESGVYWGTLLDYAKTFQDNSLSSDIAGALSLASYGPVGSFLGALSAVAATLQGKWNDDIMWWGMATATGAELFGKTAVLPGGKSYLEVAQRTYDEAFEQWDTQCGGGIYWSRDRQNQKTKGYKSTITNVQHMLLGAKLYILTGNKTYIDNAQLVYSWLKQRIITSEGLVYDGQDVDQNCGVSTSLYSYNFGILMGSMAWLGKATNNNQWFSDASVILRAAQANYVKSGVLVDECEPNCRLNQIQFKALLARGMGYLSALSNVQADRDAIKSVLRSSMQAMTPLCDANGNCPEVWSGGQQTNFHRQITALELINAYSTSQQGTIPSVTFAPPAQNTPTTKSGSAGLAPRLLVLLVLLCLQ
ncbi:glycoside hydrolase [Gorgonomyces haynaldii]|nr:glycoside hydrolase [Gorgonomyces haynaldii]